MKHYIEFKKDLCGVKDKDLGNAIADAKADMKHGESLIYHRGKPGFRDAEDRRDIAWSFRRNGFALVARPMRAINRAKTRVLKATAQFPEEEIWNDVREWEYILQRVAK